MDLGSRKPPIICNLPGIYLWVLDMLCIVFFVSICISWRVAEVSLSLLTSNMTHFFVSSAQGLYVHGAQYGCYRSRQSEVGWAKWLHHPTGNVEPVLRSTQQALNWPHWPAESAWACGGHISHHLQKDWFHGKANRQVVLPHEWSHNQPPEGNGAVSQH